MSETLYRRAKSHDLNDMGECRNCGDGMSNMYQAPTGRCRGYVRVESPDDVPTLDLEEVSTDLLMAEIERRLRGYERLKPWEGLPDFVDEMQLAAHRYKHKKVRDPRPDGTDGTVTEHVAMTTPPPPPDPHPAEWPRHEGRSTSPKHPNTCSACGWALDHPIHQTTTPQ